MSTKKKYSDNQIQEIVITLFLVIVMSFIFIKVLFL